MTGISLTAVAMVLMISAALGSPARAMSGLCLSAAEDAAREHDIPEGVLQGISTVETRGHRDAPDAPWPWTLNVAGQGFWFDDQDAALAHARAAIDAGERLIDLGCFQLNYYWHGSAFRKLGDMLDPNRTAQYAAGFLQALYRETGDWMKAIGFYHSRRRDAAQRYRRLVTSAIERSSEGFAEIRLTVGTAGSLWRFAEPSSSGSAPRAGATGLGMLMQSRRHLIGAGEGPSDG